LEDWHTLIIVYTSIRKNYFLIFKTETMKQIFTLSALALVAAVILNGCTKEQFSNIDENYWLSRERGEVVYSDRYCNFYVIETNNGYAVIRSYGGYKPLEGSIMYGDFSHAGTKDMYNRSSGNIFTGTVTDYWLSYNAALNAMDYYCPLKNSEKHVFKNVPGTL